MASSAINDQRRKEDLELLALFDPDCPQDLSMYESVYGLSSATVESSVESAPPNSNEFPTMNENENVDVESFLNSIDEATLAYIDGIIATNAASGSRALEPESSSSDVQDAAFSMPRKYKCPMCPKQFLSKTTMQKHGRRHILKQIKCQCGFRGQSPVQKHKHYLYHHVGMPKQKFLASF